MIEFKIMKVDSQKLTPSLFKQLQQKKIVGDRSQLLGTPIARIEYHYGCAEWQRKRYGSHLHILWVEDDQLRHAIEMLGDNLRSLSPWSELLELEQIFI